MSLVVSVVGWSDSGKTTLLEKLIVELKRRGYTVAAVKHSGCDFQLDHPGKDSWRFAEAGSDAIMLASPNGLAYLEKSSHPPTFEEVIDLLGDKYDFILVEGFKESSLAKIEVHRKELGGLATPPEKLFAVVTDEHLDVSAPQFSTRDTADLVDLLEKRLAVPSWAGTVLPDG